MHLMAFALVAAPAATVRQIGLDTMATQMKKDSPAIFDLAGFRLGMTEAAAESAIKERGMTVKRRTRTDTFDNRVRKLVNIRCGRLQLKGGSNLDNADIDDGKGGRIFMQMLGWPDGARISKISYQPPASTGPADRRGLLIGRYGLP